MGWVRALCNVLTKIVFEAPEPTKAELEVYRHAVRDRVQDLEDKPDNPRVVQNPAMLPLTPRAPMPKSLRDDLNCPDAPLDCPLSREQFGDAFEPAEQSPENDEAVDVVSTCSSYLDSSRVSPPVRAQHSPVVGMGTNKEVLRQRLLQSCDGATTFDEERPAAAEFWRRAEPDTGSGIEEVDSGVDMEFWRCHDGGDGFINV
eukprot:NODE_22687_length_699_cov_0.793706.p1 GENE.NODE_22687_length_699_cov_0.793706~~NODE_22687_length_699_cov_0.793706.p1  ORF type:complete len:202 (-),score=77.39 NODE_22687_length_699_cov_0.793706:92-697(-)